MPSLAVFVSILAGYLLNIWIMLEVIKIATQTNRKIKLDEAQIKLLASIARKLQVDDKEISSAVKEL